MMASSSRGDVAPEQVGPRLAVVGRRWLGGTYGIHGAKHKSMSAIFTHDG
jgi:hypothetical protein